MAVPVTTFTFTLERLLACLLAVASVSVGICPRLADDELIHVCSKLATQLDSATQLAHAFMLSFMLTSDAWTEGFL